MPIAYETHDNAPPAATGIVDAGLSDANVAAAPLADVVALTCFARDDANAVIGGAVGRTWGECCELQQLWVAAPNRQRGIGAALVRRFEARAKERGCRTFYVTTFSFQAPSLYRRLGYRAAAEIRGFPSGIVKYLMVRTVASDES